MIDVNNSKYNFAELETLYQENFSLDYLGKDIGNKIALISLICYVTYKSWEKKPDTSYYSVITQLSKGLDLPNKFIKSLALHCANFGYGCTEFPLFGLQGKEIIEKIREILKSYTPF